MERFTIFLDSELAKEFDALIAERGVRHGKLNLVAVEVDQRHAHGYKPRGNNATHGGKHHVHLKPSR